MIIEADALLANGWEHFRIFVGGATAIGIVGHLVNTFPPPEGKYGRWILGSIQYIVGQRQQAQMTKAGYTGQFPVPPEQPQDPKP